MTTPLYGGFPFSMFDPVHLGVDENGEHVYVNLAERNMLLGGEPGGGKSSGLNLITAHGALSYDCKLILVDGKQVQLGPWRALRRHVHRPVHHRRHRRVRSLPEDHERPVRRRCSRPAGARSPATPASTSTWSSSMSTPTSPPPSAARQEREAFAALDPRPGRPGPRSRGHPHPGHPAALPPGHRPVHAGPVRLPVGVPLHHRLLLRCRARPGLGQRGLHRRRHRPAGPRRRLAAVRDRHPPPHQGRLPHRRPHQVPGRLRRRPAPTKDAA